MLGQITESTDQVYFVQGQQSKRIKIGVSRSPIKRLHALQTGSPEILDLLFYVEGSRQMEKELHEKFKYLRHAGEWFDCDKRLLDCMRDIWQHRQAHRASFMGYSKTRFHRILKTNNYDWTHKTHINKALYWVGSADFGHPAIGQFKPARLPRRMRNQ